VAFRERALTISAVSLIGLAVALGTAACGGSDAPEPARFVQGKSGSQALGSMLESALGVKASEVANAVNGQLVQMLAASGVSATDDCFAFDSLGRGHLEPERLPAAGITGTGDWHP
jgi:hypothetical protein